MNVWEGNWKHAAWMGFSIACIYSAADLAIALFSYPAFLIGGFYASRPFGIVSGYMQFPGTAFASICKFNGVASVLTDYCLNYGALMMTPIITFVFVWTAAFVVLYFFFKKQPLTNKEK